MYIIYMHVHVCYKHLLQALVTSTCIKVLKSMVHIMYLIFKHIVSSRIRNTKGA